MLMYPRLYLQVGSAKWPNLLRYCSPNLCKRKNFLLFCPSTRFKSIVLWPGMNYLVPFSILWHSFLFINRLWLYNIQLTTRRGNSFAPLWCLCQKLSLSPLYFNKTWLHKSSEWSSLVSGSGLNSSPLQAKNPGVLSFRNNLSVVWTFFGIVVFWGGNEKRPLWTLLSFSTLLVYWVQHFNSIHLLGYDIAQQEFHYIH